MKLEDQYPIVKRIKSWLWRSAMMGLAVAVAAGLENLNILELSPFWTTAIGLVLGEVSKWLNTPKNER